MNKISNYQFYSITDPKIPDPKPSGFEKVCNIALNALKAVASAFICYPEPRNTPKQEEKNSPQNKYTKAKKSLENTLGEIEDSAKYANYPRTAELSMPIENKIFEYQSTEIEINNYEKIDVDTLKALNNNKKINSQEKVKFYAEIIQDQNAPELLKNTAIDIMSDVPNLNALKNNNKISEQEKNEVYTKIVDNKNVSQIAKNTVFEFRQGLPSKEDLKGKKIIHKKSTGYEFSSEPGQGVSTKEDLKDKKVNPGKIPDYIF